MPPRPRHPMPEYVRKALASRGLTKAYRSRPAYQRNDYIGWITRARLDTTRKKRPNQMLDEMKCGGVYMKMKWRPR